MYYTYTFPMLLTRDEPVVRNSGLFAGPERRTGGPVRFGSEIAGLFTGLEVIFGLF